ncbi:MAG: DoxX family protein [Myxococcota bacterium]
MESLLARIGPLSHALVRIVAGLLFACHGAQKIFGLFGGFGGTPGATAPLFTLLWFGGIVELVGGALVALGVRTSIAAFICSGQMAVAYFMFHQPNGPLPIQNGGELAALYAFVFLFLAARGPGPLALERGGSR